MNDYNARIAQDVLDAIDGFEAGAISLEYVHGVLARSVSLFENDDSGIAAAVSLAEVALEEIEFTVLLEEQRSEAIRRLRKLRQDIVGAPSG